MISLKPPRPVGVGAQHLDLPALALGVAAVHAEQLGGEQARLLAAGAGADLEQRRCARRWGPWAAAGCVSRSSSASAPLRAAPGSSSLASSRMSASRRLEQRAVPLDLLAELLPLAVGGDDRLELGALLGQAGEVLAAARHRRIDRAAPRDRRSGARRLPACPACGRSRRRDEKGRRGNPPSPFVRCCSAGPEPARAALLRLLACRTCGGSARRGRRCRSASACR